MAENENIVVNEMPPAEQPEENKFFKILKKIWAGIKEWARKQVVTLKRSPQRIPLLVTAISTIIWLFSLFSISRAVNNAYSIEWIGLVVFASTMLAILVIPLFLNSFPKRKKPNFIFIALVFVFMAGMVALDYVYYSMITDFLLGQSTEYVASATYFTSATNAVITHLVFVCISAALLALIPAYAPLIKKINTSKNIEDNNIHEAIELEDDDE